MRDRNARAGGGVGDDDRRVELIGQGIDDAGAEARFFRFVFGGHADAVVGDGKLPPGRAAPIFDGDAAGLGGRGRRV